MSSEFGILTLRRSLHCTGCGNALTWLICLITFAGCGTKHDDGLSKFPVVGTVYVDGLPAEGVVVRFFRDGKPGTSNADTPLGVTDAEGIFRISTNDVNDGAVAGDYRVTFTWKNGNSPMAKDRLEGRYTKLDESRFNVTVKPEDNELEAFSLETSSDKDKTLTQQSTGRAELNVPVSDPVSDPG